MKIFKIFLVPPIIVSTILIFIFGIFLIKWFWMWTVPGIFPGAVEQGLIAGQITWWTALKLSIMVSLIATITHITKK